MSNIDAKKLIGSLPNQGQKGTGSVDSNAKQKKGCGVIMGLIEYFKNKEILRYKNQRLSILEIKT